MFSVHSIIIAIRLPKSLCGEILKMVAYLKNYSPSQKRVTLYERANEEKSNLKHLRIVGSQAWVNLSYKPRKKLNDIA